MIYLFSTIFLWSSLAIFAEQINHLPSLLTLGVSFFLGTLLGVKSFNKDTSLKAIIITSVSYFFYHFFLYESFRYAPVLEANLIQYLWPSFIIILGPVLIKGEKYNNSFFVALVGSIVALSILGINAFDSLTSIHLRGYLYAFGAAVVWSIFSIISKGDSNFNQKSVSIGCMSTSLVSLLIYFTFQKEGKLDIQLYNIIFLVIIGLGPFGLAFYLWDKSLKECSTKQIGVASLLTPVLSNLLLFIFGDQELKVHFIFAGIVIILTPIAIYFLSHDKKRYML